ncbi:ribonuclease R [Rubricella aquisinus]|uniref:Ribonuclease R n=1 Tax=Rubricella aquisinus TaxID=2028108 RepID=A0A840WL86_9RHOB|nr:ribonuclease R [Rubricella aquisinus]MBB5514412.1 ribonuclease R [Rubricella aquisinus]
MSNLPSKDQIVEWLSAHPGQSGKREVARAFGIKGSDRIPLKRMLRELEADGVIARGPRRKLLPAGDLPPVAVLRVLPPDADGDLWASPEQWEHTTPPPRIHITLKRGDPAPGAGDRVLTKIHKADDGWTGRVIRKIGSGPTKVVGIYRHGVEAGRIVPVDKKSDTEYLIAPGDRNGARDGELVEGERVGPKNRLGLPRARIIERLGDPGAPKSVSLIAIHEHGIPDAFPESTVKEALRARPVPLGKREDLRDLPLITIDPSDARDHDDAVCAMPDPENDGGHVVWVVIADVAHYVTPGSALDQEARRRGNSTYFPDRVVPMLPEQLSGDLCSLHEGVDRPTIAVRMRFGPDGRKLGHSFHRGLMRSPASLSYEQAQAAIDGQPDEATADLLDPVLRPLWAAYRAVLQARATRAPLNLDLPERKIVLSDAGEVTSVAFRDRFDAHKLIEEFMIQANVCAAETLEAKKSALLYRVHEEPTVEKLDALREIVAACGLTLAKGQVLHTRHLNALLDGAAGTQNAELVNLSVLRSMTQAYYAPENFSHFGLNLRRYAHFTSPIRRYADLIVHRALITAHGWGKDGLSHEETLILDQTAEHISQTERRSMLAERDTTDRYLAAFLAERVGQEFAGRVSGIARFGLFVKLDETGADGLIPISKLGTEYFRHDPDAQTLTGERSGTVIGLGQPVTVRLADAVPVTGGLLLELLSLDGTALARPRQGKGRGGKGGAPKRALAKAKIRRNKSRKSRG